MNGEIKTPGTVSLALKNNNNTNYIGEIWIGSPPQKIRALFDTGSANSWILGSKCRNKQTLREHHHFFDSDRSPTWLATGEHATIFFGSGNLQGDFGKDDFLLKDCWCESKSRLVNFRPSLLVNHFRRDFRCYHRPGLPWNGRRCWSTSFRSNDGSRSLGGEQVQLLPFLKRGRRWRVVFRGRKLVKIPRRPGVPRCVRQTLLVSETRRYQAEWEVSWALQR